MFIFSSRSEKVEPWKYWGIYVAFAFSWILSFGIHSVMINHGYGPPTVFFSYIPAFFPTLLFIVIMPRQYIIYEDSLNYRRLWLNKYIDLNYINYILITSENNILSSVKFYSDTTPMYDIPMFGLPVDKKIPFLTALIYTASKMEIEVESEMEFEQASEEELSEYYFESE